MTPTGEQIIDAVIRACALVSSSRRDDGSFIFVWSANAAEQIEAALKEIQTETETPQEDG